MVIRENLSPTRMAEIDVRSRAVYRQPGVLEQSGTLEALSTQTLDPLYATVITAQAPNTSKPIKLV